MRVLTVAADRPGAYPTIGSALLEAPDGATVAIAAGEYAETLELTGRSITLQAEAGATVVRDGDGADWPTLRAVDGELNLRGLDVRAGDNLAISVDRTELTVEQCRVGSRTRPAISVHASTAFTANPGLASRFSKTIEFENYSAEELLLITDRMVAGGDYLLDPAAGPPLTAYFDRIAHGANFDNAREARRLVEGMRKAQSQRLRSLGRMPTTDELRSLLAADVLSAAGA